MIVTVLQGDEIQVYCTRSGSYKSACLNSLNSVFSLIWLWALKALYPNARHFPATHCSATAYSMTCYRTLQQVSATRPIDRPYINKPYGLNTDDGRKQGWTFWYSGLCSLSIQEEFKKEKKEVVRDTEMEMVSKETRQFFPSLSLHIRRKGCPRKKLSCVRHYCVSCFTTNHENNVQFLWQNFRRHVAGHERFPKTNCFTNNR